MSHNTLVSEMGGHFQGVTETSSRHARSMLGPWLHRRCSLQSVWQISPSDLAAKQKTLGLSHWGRGVTYWKAFLELESTVSNFDAAPDAAGFFFALTTCLKSHATPDPKLSIEWRMPKTSTAFTRTFTKRYLRFLRGFQQLPSHRAISEVKIWNEFGSHLCNATPIFT